MIQRMKTACEVLFLFLSLVGMIYLRRHGYIAPWPEGSGRMEWEK